MSNNARAAVTNSHDSIGNAIYYTSITVVIGFSVLSFSNFVPTIHFGLMTALAMVLALERREPRKYSHFYNSTIWQVTR